MNNSFYTVIVAQGLDEEGQVVNIMEVIYCDDHKLANQIAEFVYEARDRKCICLIQTMPFSRFEDVFNHYMKTNYGKDHNGNIVN